MRQVPTKNGNTSYSRRCAKHFRWLLETRSFEVISMHNAIGTQEGDDFLWHENLMDSLITAICAELLRLQIGGRRNERRQRLSRMWLVMNCMDLGVDDCSKWKRWT